MPLPLAVFFAGFKATRPHFVYCEQLHMPVDNIDEQILSADGKTSDGRGEGGVGESLMSSG